MSEEAKVQVSVAVGEGLREKLEEAARRAVRSLSGEIVFRLQRSFESREIDDAA
jgi:Arc-like DNA binding domain